MCRHVGDVQVGIVGNVWDEVARHIQAVHFSQSLDATNKSSGLLSAITERIAPWVCALICLCREE